MISKLLARPAACALAGLFLAAPLASAANYPFTETFSTDGDAEGWTGLSTGTGPTVAQVPATDVLSFATAGYTALFLIADATASGGAFTGSFPAAGVTGLSFDLKIDLGSDVAGLLVDLLDVDTGEEWQYALALPAFGSAAAFAVPLTPDGLGWTQVAGGNPFAFILANTDELALGFTSAATGNASGTLDNVTTVPEPTAALLLLCGGAALARRRCRAGK